MPYRYPYSNRSRRRRRPILAGVVLIALVAAISYGGATLWQHYDDQRLTRNMSQGSASPQSASSSEDVLAASGDEVSEAEGEAASQDSSSSQEESQAAAQELVYGQPVPESDWASTSYFDDAVFVGDSITDGIKLYGVMNNATVIAHTGINPATKPDNNKTTSATTAAPNEISGWMASGAPLDVTTLSIAARINTPRHNPPQPAMMVSTKLSVIICETIEEGLAPIARRIPISLVRSLTVTIMILLIPTTPASNVPRLTIQINMLMPKKSI